MTTQPPPPSTGAEPDRRTAPERRTAFRRLVLSAARGEPLLEVAKAGVTAVQMTCGSPVVQLSALEPPDGSGFRLRPVHAVGTTEHPDLASALSNGTPDEPMAMALATGRARWTGPKDGRPFHLAIPVSHGDLVGALDIVAEEPREVDASLLEDIGSLAEILGAAIARELAIASISPATLPGAAGRPASAAEQAMYERLELDQQRLRAAEAIGQFGVWELLPGQRFSWSEELCRIHGVPTDFIPTFESNLALILPEDLPVVDAYMSQMRTDRAAPPLRYRIRRPDGEVRWIESYVKVLEGDRVIGVSRDITEQRRREQRDRLLSKIADTMIEGVSLVRGDGTILYVNRQYAAMYGAEPSDFEGGFIWDHIVSDKPVPRGTVTIPEPGNIRFEIRHARPDGTEFITEANVTAMPIDDGEPGELAWLAVERDITEEKLQSEALRASEERLRLIQRHAPIGLALIDLDGRFVQTNPALCALTGRTADELAALRLADITHPADLRLCELGISSLLEGRRSTFSTEQRYFRADGSTVWAALTVALARDDEGVPQHLIAQVMDIAARKQAEEARARHALELERSNAELRRATEAAERANQAKNEFLSRMSHELRTPLNAVLGFTQLLSLEDLTEVQHETVNQVLHAGRHLLLLIDEVFHIARMEGGTMTFLVEPVDVGAAIDHARTMVEPLAREREVTIRVPADPTALPIVGADRKRVEQILVNLLSNGVKYNEPGGSVTVTVNVTGDRMRLDVADTGPGIAPEALPRLFEPFDRLGAEHTDVEGTGIGLTVSRALAEQMDGKLTVRSTVGEGTTFTLELPLLTRATAAPSL